MTPQEKAQELVNWGITFGAAESVAKMFATKIVEEIIKDREYLSEFHWIDQDYWDEVKQEIEKL